MGTVAQSDAVRAAVALGERAVHLDKPHPMAAEIAEHQKALRRARAASEKLAFQMLSDIFGIKLPRSLSWKDEASGDLYEILLSPNVRLVQKGGNSDG